MSSGSVATCLVVSPSLLQIDHIWPEICIFARPCWLIWCPVGGLVGGCGARAVSRKTPIYFIFSQLLTGGGEQCPDREKEHTLYKQEERCDNEKCESEQEREIQFCKCLLQLLTMASGARGAKCLRLVER